MKSKVCVVLISILLLAGLKAGTALGEVSFSGYLENLFVLRDYNGFGYDFLDRTEGVQWKTTARLEIDWGIDKTVGPLEVDKVFLAYRGGYDAIFDLRDQYKNIPEEELSEFEPGKKQLEYDNDLREWYVDLRFGRSSLRLGRQVVGWGEADVFTVLNVVNPLDSSTTFFFQNVEEMTIPLGMAKYTYSWPCLGPFTNADVELLAIPDVRPTLSPTFSEFSPYMPPAYVAFMHMVAEGMKATYPFPTDMPGVSAWDLGYRPRDQFREVVPSRTLDNMDYGARFSGLLGGVNFSLVYFYGIQDDPAMDMTLMVTPPYAGPAYLVHPRTSTLGASFNWFDKFTKCVFKGELAYINDATITDNYAFPSLLTEVNTTKYMVGLERPTWMRWLNPIATVYLELEAYYDRIHSFRDGMVPSWGPKEESWRFMATATSSYHHGFVTPLLAVVYDPTGVWMENFSLDWIITKNFKLSVGEVGFFGNRDANNVFAQYGFLDLGEVYVKTTYIW